MPCIAEAWVYKSTQVRPNPTCGDSEGTSPMCPTLLRVALGSNSGVSPYAWVAHTRNNLTPCLISCRGHGKPVSSATCNEQPRRRDWKQRRLNQREYDSVPLPCGLSRELEADARPRRQCCARMPPNWDHAWHRLTPSASANPCCRSLNASCGAGMRGGLCMSIRPPFG